MEASYQFSNAKITIISDVTPEEGKQNLIKLYDTINRIANKKRTNGENVDDWFYKQEEIEQMKLNNDPRLI